MKTIADYDHQIETLKKLAAHFVRKGSKFFGRYLLTIKHIKEAKAARNALKKAAKAKAKAAA